jgi:hypothetical protein
MKQYGTITPQDPKDNLKQLETPWDPETPNEAVFSHSENCRQFESKERVGRKEIESKK